MAYTLTATLLELDGTNFRGTDGVSDDDGCGGFQPAFLDRDKRKVYLSRFPDGRLAPCHLPDGLPAELVRARSEQGEVTCLDPSVAFGFLHDGCFYTREEAAAMLVAAPDRSYVATPMNG
jgi:hypothetical protein